MESKLSFYWRVCAGFTFLFLLFYTAMLAAIIFIPILLPLFAVHFPLTRWLTDVLVGSWLAFAPGIYELLYGVKIKVTGDVSKLNKDACSLVLLNHRTRLDWMFILSLQARYASLKHFRISLKYPIRHVPGAGWAMQIGGFLFLKRTFEEDKDRIENLLTHFKTWHCGPQLLLFPEGTDFRDDSLESSKRFAKKTNLPEYDYVLHPRTTGFVSMYQFMRQNNQLDQVVDVTIGYPKNMVQNEDDLLTKRFPQEILFHVRVFETNNIPRDTSRLRTWLQERWREKEDILKNFYQTKCWPEKEANLNFAQKLAIERDTVLYYLGSILFWGLLSCMTAYLAVSCLVIRWYLFLSFILCAVLGHGVGIESLFKKLDRT